jgi:hypothetical protein
MTTSGIISQIRSRQQVITLTDILDWDHNTNKKEDKISEYPEDILALSCCIQRMSYGLSPGSRFNKSLQAEQLGSLVTDLDRQKAQNIRKYYSEKLLMLTLQGKELTKFRKDLQCFLNSDATKVLESQHGIVYRLPYFYDYDKSVDEIFKSSYFKNSQVSDMKEPVQRDLKFLKKLEIQRKHIDNIEYWFEDTKLNKVMFSIASNNPLLDLLDRHISDGKMSVVSKYTLRKKDLNEYFVMDRWSFV